MHAHNRLYDHTVTVSMKYELNLFNFACKVVKLFKIVVTVKT